MKDDVFITFLMKTLFVTLGLLLLQLLSGKFLLPIIFSGRHSTMWPKVFVLATAFSVCGLAFSHWLTFVKSLKNGGVIVVTLLAMFLSALVILALDIMVGGTFFRFSASEHTIDYFSLLVIVIISFLMTLPLGGCYKIFLHYLKR